MLAKTLVALMIAGFLFTFGGSTVAFAVSKQADNKKGICEAKEMDNRGGNDGGRGGKNGGRGGNDGDRGGKNGGGRGGKNGGRG